MKRDKAKEVLKWIEMRDGRFCFKKNTPYWVLRIAREAISLDDRFGLEMLYYALTTIIDNDDESVLGDYIPIYNSELLEWLDLRRAYYVDEVLKEQGCNIDFFDILREAYYQEQLDVYYTILKQLENEEVEDEDTE